MSIFSLLTGVPGVGASDVEPMLDAGGVVVDVREPREWLAGHAPQAEHIPLRDFGRVAPRLPKDRPIVVVCRSGNRSRAAVKALVDAGYDARNLNGGMLAWVRAGLPVVAEGRRPPVIV